MTEAALGLGGNLGDPRTAIAEALSRLATRGVRLLARSSDYRTPPWGKTDQPAFVNACALVETQLSPHALLDACLAVEAEFGRVRLERWGPRTLDIDILTYDGLVLDDARLALPHPRLTERGFVLIPLAEIAPDLLVGGKRVADLARRFAGEPIVRLGAPEDIRHD